MPLQRERWLLEMHARRISDLVVCELRLDQRVCRTRHAIDRALVRARRDGVAHKTLAYAAVKAALIIRLITVW